MSIFKNRIHTKKTCSTDCHNIISSALPPVFHECTRITLTMLYAKSQVNSQFQRTYDLTITVTI